MFSTQQTATADEHSSLSGITLGYCNDFLRERSGGLSGLFQKVRGYDTECQIIASLRAHARRSEGQALINQVDQALTELSQLKLSSLGNELRNNLHSLNQEEKARLEERRQQIKLTEHIPDHYSVLGIERTATLPEITKAYRSAARENRRGMIGMSDLNDIASEINEAYRVLRDDDLRENYDQSLQEYEEMCHEERSETSNQDENDISHSANF